MRLIREHRPIVIAIAVYAIIFGLIGIYRQYNFQTQTWDMGLFDQLFWNTAHGRFFETSIAELPNHLGVHWSPALLLLLPFYALAPSPYTLILLQTFALALAAWPLYLLALRVLGNKRWAQLIGLLYLAHPSLHWVNMFDFHEIAFIAPLLFAAAHLFEKQSYGWAMAALAVAASFKEDAMLAVLFMGIYWLVQKWRAQKPRLWSIGAIALSTLYFIVTIRVLMPHFGGGLLRLDRYANLGSSPGAILGTLAFHPLVVLKAIFQLPKLFYVLWLFLPVGFLPFFAPQTLILAIPGLAENLLTSYENQFASLYQYDAMLIPAIFIGAVYGLHNLLGRYPAYSKKIRGALCVFAVAAFFMRSPVNPFTFPFALFGTNIRWESLRQMAALVPADASVSAQTNIVPHLSHRTKIYMLGAEPAPVDYVLLDGADAFGFKDAGAFNAYVDSYVKSGNYTVTTIGGRYAVLARKMLR